ncbi:helix-turn-helix domain-containing protein [Streptomyces sp. NPDC059071]|uniref:helix-turn-helix domain-containing protein n=1 Tax=unclassified Streptomyces TaxID=2593676 RepID=UPI00365EBE12
MSRPEAPIADGAACTLAAWLRARRHDAQLSYRELAQRTSLSTSTLSRAASGNRVPPLAVVRAYAQACGADPDEAERLWKQAWYDSTAKKRPLSYRIHVDCVRTYADLHAALIDLYHRQGSPPYRQLEARAGGHGQLPHATVGRVLSRQSRPRQEFVLAFAQACGDTSGSRLAAWSRAWKRAEEDRLSRQPPQPAAAEQHLERELRFSADTDGALKVQMTPLLDRVLHTAAASSRHEGKGVPCAGCGHRITTYSDAAAALGSLMWCLSCGHAATARAGEAQLVLDLDVGGPVLRHRRRRYLE